MKLIEFHTANPEIAGDIVIDRGVCHPCDAMIVIEMPQIERSVSVYIGEGGVVLKVDRIDDSTIEGLFTLNAITILEANKNAMD